MECRKLANTCVKILLPLALGGAILYWMYRGFDFGSIKHALLHEMDWTWMAASFPFGILAQMLRGWRWRQTLEPVGERPRTAVSVYSIFLSYATSLVIPRVGEFTRCGVLKRYDGVSFAKALGTVVTERVIDSLLVLVVTAVMLLCQIRIFSTFFDRTGTSLESILGGFSTFYGPVIGAVLIPVASSCVGFLANFPAFSGISRWQMVVVYVLMLFAILLKPEGLFGKKTIKKV